MCPSLRAGEEEEGEEEELQERELPKPTAAGGTSAAHQEGPPEQRGGRDETLEVGEEGVAVVLVPEGHREERGAFVGYVAARRQSAAAGGGSGGGGAPSPSVALPGKSEAYFTN